MLHYLVKTQHFWSWFTIVNMHVIIIIIVVVAEYNCVRNYLHCHEDPCLVSSHPIHSQFAFYNLDN